MKKEPADSMTEGRNRTITLVLVALILSAGSFFICYILLNLGIWSWLIGLLVLLICLFFILPQLRVKREERRRGKVTDEEGFQKKERVFNRTISRPAAGPLWKSRTYGLRQGDMLRVEVIADHEVTARLVRSGPGSIKEDVDSSNGPVKRWSKRIEIREDGNHHVVLDSAHPKVTVTVKIGHRPDGSK
jgi:hypothetical protein